MYINTPLLFILKVKSKGKGHPKEATKAQRGIEILIYSFFNLGSRWEWVVNATFRPLYPRETDPIPIL